MPALILDRRSRPARLVQQFWRHCAGETGHWVSWLERPAATFTAELMARRVRQRPDPPARPFLVSVGNLRLGGTGKTPVVAALARDLARRGLAGAILTRGYGSSLAGPLRVAADDILAADEARLLATLVPGWPVVQSRNRAAGLGLLREDEIRPDIVILEDGYQTAGVPRHLDVLILDHWRTVDGVVAPAVGWVMPFGPYREPATAAERADVWLLEAEPRELPGMLGAVRDRPLLLFRRQTHLAGELARKPGTGWGAVSGIARPESFESMCTEIMGEEPRLLARFDDHHTYRHRDVKGLLDAGRKAGVTTWLTTRKDWVKLVVLWSPDIPLLVVDLEIVWEGEKTLPDLVEERFLKAAVG